MRQKVTPGGESRLTGEIMQTCEVCNDAGHITTFDGFVFSFVWGGVFQLNSRGGTKSESLPCGFETGAEASAGAVVPGAGVGVAASTGVSTAARYDVSGYIGLPRVQNPEETRHNHDRKGQAVVAPPSNLPPQDF